MTLGLMIYRVEDPAGSQFNNCDDDDDGDDGDGDDDDGDDGEYNDDSNIDEKYDDDDDNDAPAPTIAITILGVETNVWCGNQEAAWS